jgi:hypothetical protein
LIIEIILRNKSGIGTTAEENGQHLGRGSRTSARAPVYFGRSRFAVHQWQSPQPTHARIVRAWYFSVVVVVVSRTAFWISFRPSTSTSKWE